MEQINLSQALLTALFSMFVDSNNPTTTTSEKINSSAETYITSTDSHCKVLNPYPQPNESITWSGACVDGFASGKGTIQWYEDGKKTDIFIGQFRHGKQYGAGKAIWANGDIYEGNYFDDKPHGNGKYIWANGSSYIGGYKNGERNGFGTLALVKKDGGLKDWEQDNLGHWQGNVYIVQGMFSHENLEIKCSSIEKCKQKKEK